jgi:hypothetical protein
MPGLPRITLNPQAIRAKGSQVFAIPYWKFARKEYAARGHDCLPAEVYSQKLASK